MEKTNQAGRDEKRVKSLKLHKETIRLLEASELTLVAAGVSALNSCNTGCNTRSCCNWT